MTGHSLWSWNGVVNHHLMHFFHSDENDDENDDDVQEDSVILQKK